MRVLILKPSSLGDVVQGLPVLRAIRQRHPDSQVFWWIDTTLAPLLEGDPDLAGLVRFERREWARPANLAGLAREIRRCRDLSLDWVIDLQCLARSAAFAWLAGGELTVGLDESREGARGFYDLIAPRPTFHTHAVDWYLGVLPLLGVPRPRTFEWLPERRETAAAIRAKWPVEEASWVLLQPGARWHNKRWPTEQFAALVRLAAAARPELRFAILGSLADRPLGEALIQAAPERCLDLTGRLSLPEMVEWIRCGRIMVSNDTGPMHVAAAVGTPVIGLFGPTEPRRTGPYGQLDHTMSLSLPCVPCMKPVCRLDPPCECLRSLAPAAVFAAMEKRLAKPGLQRV